MSASRGLPQTLLQKIPGRKRGVTRRCSREVGKSTSLGQEHRDVRTDVPCGDCNPVKDVALSVYFINTPLDCQFTFDHKG